jgi:predicted lipase
VAGQGIKGFVDVTTGLVAKTAAYTPGVKQFVATYVHCGFWSAYLQVRSYVHNALRKELVKNPTSVFFTGHSLG